MAGPLGHYLFVWPGLGSRRSIQRERASGEALWKMNLMV